MSAVNKTIGLMMLGVGLSVVLWTSGRATPIVERVAGILSSEIGTAAAGGNGEAGWGG